MIPLKLIRDSDEATLSFGEETSLIKLSKATAFSVSMNNTPIDLQKIHSRKIIRSCSGLGITGRLSNLHHPSIIDDDFETYDGGLGTWQKWEPTDMFPLVDSVVFHSGLKSIRFESEVPYSAYPKTMMKKDLGYEGIQEIGFYFRLSGSIIEVPAFSILSSDNDSKWLVMISVGPGGHLYYNAPDGSLIDTGFALSADTWHRIRILQNMVEKKYSVWADDVLVIDNVDGEGEDEPYGYKNMILFYKVAGFTGMYFWIDDLTIGEPNFLKKTLAEQDKKFAIELRLKGESTIICHLKNVTLNSDELPIEPGVLTDTLNFSAEDAELVVI